jgi:hypothetical protein
MQDDNKPAGIGSRYVRLHVSPEGQTTVEAFGFDGETCQAATRNVENALGRVSSRTKKDDEGGGSYQQVG